jgi:hypothetical protein
MKIDKTDGFANDRKSMPVDHRRIFRSLSLVHHVLPPSGNTRSSGRTSMEAAAPRGLIPALRARTVNRGLISPYIRPPEQARRGGPARALRRFGTALRLLDASQPPGILTARRWVDRRPFSRASRPMSSTSRDVSAPIRPESPLDPRLTAFTRGHRSLPPI